MSTIDPVVPGGIPGTGDTPIVVVTPGGGGGGSVPPTPPPTPPPTTPPTSICYEFSQAKQALAQRLYNSIKTFFSDAELGLYILESLQTFNALANYYRREFVFTAAPSVTWYDITDTVNLPNTLRPLTTTDQSLVSMIEYHFLEPQTSTYPLNWTGSRQFSISDILNAIQQTRDQLLSESDCTLTHAVLPGTPGRVIMPDATINLRRVAWLPVNGFGYTPNLLLPSDVWSDQAFTAAFPQQPPATPLSYRRSTSQPRSFDVDIQPAIPGVYDVLTVNGGNTLSTFASTVLPIPNDWCWALKWGAIAQLMSRESAARDTLRAEYCWGRYQQAVATMRSAPAVLAARINDVPVMVEELTNADFYRANWQGLSLGTPDSIYYAGMNQLALAPIPDSNAPYSVTVSVIQNMPLPTVDWECLQVERDDIAAILDYAQHLAMFKCGGYEFRESYQLYENFMRRCQLYNSRLAAWSPFLEFIDGRSSADRQLNPDFMQPDPVTLGAHSVAWQNIAGPGGSGG